MPQILIQVGRSCCTVVVFVLYFSKMAFSRHKQPSQLREERMFPSPPPENTSWCEAAEFGGGWGGVEVGHLLYVEQPKKQ